MQITCRRETKKEEVEFEKVVNGLEREDIAKQEKFIYNENEM